MANAQVPENHIQEWNDGGVDSDEEEEAGTSKLNGIPSNGLEPHVDRYGFSGGDRFTDPEKERRVPLEVIRNRESKWIDMFNNWEKFMSKRFKTVKARCRKGIPSSVRSRAWQYLCGSKFALEHPDNRKRFAELLNQPGDAQCMSDIDKDLDRQFPFHELFTLKGGNGQEDLRLVLKAYSIYNPSIGYCQAQAPIAAVLLMHMPAEQAFWALVAICEKYLPGYYGTSLAAVETDGYVLFGLIKRIMPATYKHLMSHQISPTLCMTEWFMCVFTRTLPWASVLRVWDMFFCEGVKVMFRVGLVLFKFTLGESEQLAACPGLYETCDALRHLSPEIMEEEFLVKEISNLKITEHDMQREHQRQITKRRLEEERKSKNQSGRKSKRTAKTKGGQTDS